MSSADVSQSAPKRVRPPSARPVVGWREWLELPDLGVHAVKAKVDTGARTSALHAEDIEVVGEGDARRVRFRAFRHDEGDSLLAAVEIPMVELREVKSSNGQIEQRPVISTTLKLGEVIWEAEVTLTTRDQMGFRMLLGRSALVRKFLVDPARSFLAGAQLSPAKNTPSRDPTGKSPE